MSTIQRLLLILTLLFGTLALFALAINFIYDDSAEGVSLLDTNKNLSKDLNLDFSQSSNHMKDILNINQNFVLYLVW